MTPDEAAKRLEFRLSLKAQLNVEDALPDHRIGEPGRRGRIGTADAEIRKFLEDWRSEKARERGPETNIECDRDASRCPGSPLESNGFLSGDRPRSG
jgi:hypothetical protein